MKPPSTRLGHKKSRNGCLRCKARHVKCDEERPCKNCSRFGVVCSLSLASEPRGFAATTASNPSPAPPLPIQAPSPIPLFVADAAPSPATAPATSPVSVSASYDHTRAAHHACASPSVHASGSDQIAASPNWTQGESRDFFSPHWIQSLRLLHHYDTVVYRSLTRDPRTEPLWKYTVPEIAFSNEALLQGLLALSALHYAIRHPDQQREFLIVSSHLQSLALQHFSAHIHAIDETNCKAYFFLATFVYLLAMCSTANAKLLGKTISPGDIAQSFVLFQGIRTIMSVKSMDQWKEDGPLSILLVDGAKDPEPNPSGPFHERLKRLSEIARRLKGSLDPINEQTSCILAIETLRSIYLSYGEDLSSSSSRRVWVWPMTLTPIFIDLIGNEHPVALVILCHFTALVWPYESDEWVNCGWSEVVLEAAERSLDSEWKVWIEWPTKSVRERINVKNMPMPDIIREEMTAD